MSDHGIADKIEILKKEKNAVILAHYYAPDEVQSVADYVGDSYYLAKIATQLKEQIIVFAGVFFMGESAKLLNPDKKVLLPETYADCPMAHMVDIDRIIEVKKQYPNVKVVCYINSTAEIKRYADVCVTSSNALKIVKALPNKDIFFIPDENLGRYIASMVPEKNFIFNEGYCHVHKSITKESVIKAKQAKPEAIVLVHPECTMDVIDLADYVGSTSGIIDYATASEANEFIIGTEMGVLFELQKRNPNKKFYSVSHKQFCPNMKKISLDKVLDVLEKENNEIVLDEQILEQANLPLKRMLELAK